MKSVRYSARANRSRLIYTPSKRSRSEPLCLGPVLRVQHPLMCGRIPFPCPFEKDKLVGPGVIPKASDLKTKPKLRKQTAEIGRGGMPNE